MSDIDKLRLDSTGDYYNANDVEKLVDSLNKKIEEMKCCGNCGYTCELGIKYKPAKTCINFSQWIAKGIK